MPMCAGKLSIKSRSKPLGPMRPSKLRPCTTGFVTGIESFNVEWIGWCKAGILCYFIAEIYIIISL
ncbi:hypothetical protein GCM10027291_02650 [Telluribacter humicola]